MAEKRPSTTDGDDTFSPEVKRLKSCFTKQDVVLIVEGEKLYINKAELINLSPVFRAMFTSSFIEKEAPEVELPGKKLEEFLRFLRCALAGFSDDINDDNVHFVIRLADEYQVETLVIKADTYLANQYENNGYKKYKSNKIIEGLIEAEQYNLCQFHKVLVSLASRKAFKYFSTAEGFDKLPEQTLNKIALERWKTGVNADGTVETKNYVNSLVE